MKGFIYSQKDASVSKTSPASAGLFLLAVPVALSLSGCVSAQDMEAMRSDINRLQVQIAEYQDNLSKLHQELQSSVVESNQQIKAQNREMQDSISDLAATNDVIKRNQADINAKMDSMISNVMALGGKNEEGAVSAMGIGARIDSMNATLNQRLDGMDRTINQLGTTVSELEKSVEAKQPVEQPKAGEAVEGQGQGQGTEGQAQESAPQTSVQESAPESAPANAAEKTAPAAPTTTTEEAPAAQPTQEAQTEQEMPPVPVGDPTEIYQNAYADYSKGNYDLAVSGFEEFLHNFPDAMLAPNAQYWLGECYYSKRDFKKAVEEFDKVIKNYQGAIKVPSAYLKKGFSLDEQGNHEAAKVQYRKIVDAYPLSPEAAIAKEKLGEGEKK